MWVLSWSAGTSLPIGLRWHLPGSLSEGLLLLLQLLDGGAYIGQLEVEPAPFAALFAQELVDSARSHSSVRHEGSLGRKSTGRGQICGEPDRREAAFGYDDPLSGARPEQSRPVREQVEP